MPIEPAAPPPRISVIMPVYNAQPYLAASVESILRQTAGDFEFIIIDDGSRDDSPAVLAAYAAQDARVRLLRNPHNLGLTNSLNRGLEHARGEFVARQDADDLSAPDRFARQLAFLQAHPAVGVLATAITLMDEHDALLQPRYFDAWLDDRALQQQLLVDFCIAHGSVMMRRALLAQVGGYLPEREPAEDHDLWLRLGEITRLACLPEPLYHHRRHAASVSATRRSQQARRLAEVIELALRRRHAPAPGPEALRPAARAFLRASLFALHGGDAPEAARRLQHALALCPPLLASPEPLAGVLADYTAPLPVAEGLAVYERAFSGLLPRTAPLQRLRRRLSARLHMRAVFAAGHDEPQHIARHLWPGLRADPRWLLNRGVRAIALRALLARRAD